MAVADRAGHSSEKLRDARGFYLLDFCEILQTRNVVLQPGLAEPGRRRSAEVADWGELGVRAGGGGGALGGAGSP